MPRNRSEGIANLEGLEELRNGTTIVVPYKKRFVDRLLYLGVVRGIASWRGFLWEIYRTGISIAVTIRSLDRYSLV